MQVRTRFSEALDECGKLGVIVSITFNILSVWKGAEQLSSTEQSADLMSFFSRSHSSMVALQAKVEGVLCVNAIRALF